MRSIVLFLVFLCACNSPLAPVEYVPQLVVHGIFTPDSVWSVRISKSIALETPSLPNNLFLDDAVVTVTDESGRTVKLEHTGQGQYRTTSDQFPKIGEKYSIEVLHPELGTAHAVSHSPPLSSEFVSIEPLNRDTDDSSKFRIQFKVQDLPGKSYYQVTLFQLNKNCGDNTPSDNLINGRIFEPLFYHSSDPALFYSSDELDEPFDPTSSASQDFYAAVFSDRLFENTDREIELIFSSVRDSSMAEPYFLLVLSGMSEEWIQFDRTVLIQDLYLFAPDPIFSNPVEIFSNVEGGLGIFAGYTNHAYRVDREGNPWDENVVCS